MKPWLAALLEDDSGQDLIEYALLCATIGFAGAAAINFLGGAMNSTYQSWDGAVNAIADDLATAEPTSTP